MITPINNIQSNTNFQALKIKTPKKMEVLKDKPFVKSTSEKIANFVEKTKVEFKNMDEETKDLLFKVIVGFTLLGTFIGVTIHYISKIMDNINNLFQ